MLGPDNYGAYTITLVIPGILSLFLGFGVNFSVMRYVAYFVSTGDVARAVSVTRSATLFILLVGVMLSVVNYVVAPYLVSTFLHRPELAQYVQIASILVVGQAMSQGSTAAFVGWNSINEVSAFTVLQSVLKVVFTVGLVLAGFGLYGAVVGHVISYFAQGAVVTILLVVLRTRPWSHTLGHFLEDSVLMLRYGVPLFAGNIISGLASSYATIILAVLVSNAVVGFYQAAMNVTIAIGLISATVSTILFKSFATLHGLEEDTSLAFSYALKYVSFVSTPVVFFLLAAASVIFGILYGSSYSGGVFLLRLAALSNIPVCFGLTVLPAFFSGIGRSKMTFLTSLVAAIALVVASLTLAELLGLGAEGIMLALFISNLFMTLLGLVLAVKYLGVRFKALPLVEIMLAGLAASLTVLLLSTIHLSDIPAVLLDVVVFLFVYLTCAPLFHGLDEEDLIRLSISTENFGPLRGVINLILSYERRVMSLTKSPGKGAEASEG